MDKKISKLKRSESQKGFAQVFLAAGLLSLILIGLAFGQGILVWGKISQNKFRCESLVLGAQTETEVLIKKLLILNKKAAALSAKNKALNLRLAAAIASGNSAAAAAISIELNILRAKRLALELKQKNILADAHHVLVKLKAQLHQKFSGAKINTYTQLPVIATEPGPAPVYMVNPNATLLSRISVRSSQIQKNLAPEVFGLPRSYLARSEKFNWACASELAREGQEWNAILREAKS